MNSQNQTQENNDQSHANTSGQGRNAQIPKEIKSMKNNLTLKVVIGVLIVTVTGLTVKLVMTSLKLSTNITGITTTITTPPVTITSTSNLTIGDNYGGGKVAYILQSGDPGYINDGVRRGLIAATTNQSTGIYWHATYDGLTGASGTALGTGNTNTNAIVALYGTESNAGRLCYDLSLNTYTDWYLPSMDELNKLYLNRVVIGGFAAHSYWSSSEYDVNGALIQYFGDGHKYPNLKSNSGQVCCVRSF